MKTALLILLWTGTIQSYGQLHWTSTMKVGQDVVGLCDQEKVYSLFLMESHEENQAITASLPEGITIINVLNKNIEYLKTNPKFKGKFDLQVYVNCEGMLIYADLTKKTKSSALNDEIINTVSSIEKWSPGTFRNIPVDSFHNYYLMVKNGTFSIRADN